MKNTQFSTHDVRKCCETENKLGIEFKTKGKEFNGWFKRGGIKICRITVPKGRKSMGKGLYQSMANQLRLTVRQFDDLLVCPLNRNGYLEILREKGIIKSL